MSWKVVDYQLRGAAWEFGLFTIENEDTGQIKKVLIWHDSDEDFRMELLGKKIEEGDFYEDDDD